MKYLVGIALAALAGTAQAETLKVSHDDPNAYHTVQAAIDENVPAPVITLSLMARMASRQDESFSAKVAAALRNQFGGHAVKEETHA